jgi:hypothetical protein
VPRLHAQVTAASVGTHDTRHLPQGYHACARMEGCRQVLLAHATQLKLATKKVRGRQAWIHLDMYGRAPHVPVRTSVRTAVRTMQGSHSSRPNQLLQDGCLLSCSITACAHGLTASMAKK